MINFFILIIFGEIQMTFRISFYLVFVSGAIYLTVYFYVYGCITWLVCSSVSMQRKLKLNLISTISDLHKKIQI